MRGRQGSGLELAFALGIRCRLWLGEGGRVGLEVGEEGVREVGGA